MTRDRYLAGAGILYSSPPWPLWGPPSLLSRGYWGRFPRHKGAGVESDHLHPFTAKVKNIWSYTFTPLYIFMEWYLVKCRGNFSFTYWH